MHSVTQAALGCGGAVRNSTYSANGETRAVSRGGLKVGALAGLFYGVQGLSAIARDQSSLSDTVLAATVTGGVFGSFREFACRICLDAANDQRVIDREVFQC